MREPLLFLAHRIPYPPNKGDKVRSYHLFRHLAQRYDVHLAAFIDDAADRQHLDALRGLCAGMHVAAITPALARLRGLSGLLTGEPLTLPYYRDAGLRRWVERTVAERRIGRAVVFSSAMAQYVENIPGLRTIVDFVDVDSDKWRQYAPKHKWPWSAIYAREAKRLLAFERRVASAAQASFFVTAAEAELFRELAPESASRVKHFDNGVDTAYFRPDPGLPRPYADGEQVVLFTGAMDYWPNADAVCWFADEIFPAVLAARPAARFYVVGMNPAPAVQALAQRPGVTVTGRVPDVRPYLQHADVVVAPLRVARGIQNKVLEGMAMARPIVVSEACAGPLSARAGRDFLVACGAEDFARKTLCLLAGEGRPDMGPLARDCVLRHYDWEAHLSALTRELARGAQPPAASSRSAPTIAEAS